MFDHTKYIPFKPIGLPDRSWPDQQIRKAPSWCSVDLRDGNQALINPMGVEQKMNMFDLLIKIGFKEIEVGFPSASQPDFDFVRKLIDEERIPADVTIQVLTQARKELIERTYKALKGVYRAIVHVYNSTSTVQRDQVFALPPEGIINIAAQGAKWVKECAMRYPKTEWIFQYSPESFTGTDSTHAIDVCNAVLDEWRPELGQKVILNLPATVEMSTPNVFADQIEYFCRNLTRREHVIISLHTHNDRGCGVAAAELGVLAGADRIEGTLLGNGERTGNMDIVTMAMNLYSQGINPQLNLSNIVEIIDVVQDCTNIGIAPRHPWAGELVYTAFSGSHQDAIRKSIQYHKEHDQSFWNVAYLPIDPRDIGRRYEAVVRINSQSGKGGVALVLERDYNIELPKWMQIQLSKVVQAKVEKTGREIPPKDIKALYENYFVKVDDEWNLKYYQLRHNQQQVDAQFSVGNKSLKGQGAGVLEALCSALSDRFRCDIQILQFDQHAIGSGSNAEAQSSIKVKVGGESFFASATSSDSSAAALQALLTAFSKTQTASSALGVA